MGTTIIEKDDPPAITRVPIRYRLVIIIAVIAAASSFSAQPFAAIAVAGCAIIAEEIGRRVR